MTAFDQAVETIRRGSDSATLAAQLYGELTDDERLNLLDGDIYYWQGRLDIVRHGYNIAPYVMGAVNRLGIPGIRFVDGPRGCVSGHGTAFPVSMARGATWNEALEERVGEAIGEEVREQGGNLFGGVCINLPRHPAWGRIQETYSDQPVLLGSLGAALTRGVRRHAMACVKHFACNSMENARFKVDVKVDEATFHEVYGPHFKTVIDAGADAVMTAYNSVNGEYCGQNAWLIRQTLRKDWGFTGIVASDFVWGLRDVTKSVKAGLNIEEPFHQQRYTKLRAALDRGDVTWDDIRELGERILDTQLRFYAQRDMREPAGTMAGAEHAALAREVAEQSMVLLKNENNTLPLKAARRIAVIGPMAQNRLHLLGAWSAHGREEDAVSLFAGLENEYRGRAELLYARGCDFDGEDRSGFREAVAAAAAADVVVLCLGEKKQWSGENASRSTIALPEIQEQLAAELAQTGKPLVLVLSSGRPLELCRLEPLCGAMVQMWQPGIRGGNPLAGILSGRINPSGRLAMTFPRSTGQIPIYYNRRQSGRTHQGKYQDIPSTPLYEFGHGLSYTTFEYGDLRPSATTLRRGEKVTVEVSVTNTGGMDGAETVHWFISDPVCRISRPVRELKHFEKQPIRRGETRTFRFEIDPEKDLSFTDGDGNRFLEPGDYFILVKDKKVKLTLTD